jgi:tellurite resistance protein
MMDLFPEVEINEDEAQAIARGLFAVAKADGNVHERERALVSEFFASITDRPSDLAALDRQEPIAAETLALALPRGELRQLFLMTALLLALSDGDYGKGEAALIKHYAGAMEFSDAELDGLTTRVKEHMLSQLSHLSNVDAAVEVARELKL